MKRGLLLTMALLMAFGLGCKKNEQQADTFKDVPLETILEELYAEADLELPDRGNAEITAENASYYLGTDTVEFTEAVASDALIGSIPFSVCLVRVADPSKASETAEIIRTSANPNKWICVGVTSDHVVTDYAGDVVILIMAEQSNELKSAFNRVAAAQS